MTGAVRSAIKRFATERISSEIENERLIGLSYVQAFIVVKNRILDGGTHRENQIINDTLIDIGALDHVTYEHYQAINSLGDKQNVFVRHNFCWYQIIMSDDNIERRYASE